jgi:hypothetical protein
VLWEGGGRKTGIRAASNASTSQKEHAEHTEGVASHAEHVTELGLSRAQEREAENMESQFEKQEKANWMPRPPGLGDKTEAETLPQDNLRPAALGTTIPEIMGREGMFDPGSLDLRAIKELKAADVVRQDEREDGSWVHRPPAGGEGGDPPGRPGRPMDEGQLQESVDKLGERRGGGEGLGEQTKWGAKIGESDPKAGDRFNDKGQPNKEYPPQHEDPALNVRRQKAGPEDGDMMRAPTLEDGHQESAP